MAQQKHMRIFKNGQGWMVEFEDCPDIKSLFGTQILPLPYSLTEFPDRIIENLKHLNPDALVYYLGKRE